MGDTALMPESRNPLMAASACSGVREMWDQSSIVVMPALSASNAPM